MFCLKSGHLLLLFFFVGVVAVVLFILRFIRVRFLFLISLIWFFIKTFVYTFCGDKNHFKIFFKPWFLFCECLENVLICFSIWPLIWLACANNLDLLLLINLSRFFFANKLLVFIDCFSGVNKRVFFYYYLSCFSWGLWFFSWNL